MSNEIRKLEQRQYEYEKGERLICREDTKVEGKVFNVNFEYEIVVVCDNLLMLKDIKNQVVKGLNKDYIRNNFIFAHCCTAYSTQGASVDTEIAIFDYNHLLVRDYPEWLYTSINRCRDLSKVKYFKYNIDINDELNMQNIMSSFNRKVENYEV